MDFLIAIMAADAPAHTSHVLDGTGLSLVIFPLIVIVISVIYQKTKPLDMPASLPGPTRYFFIGYLHHVIIKWYDWPNESLRLCELYKKTWGGPLPKFGGLPGGYVYISHEDSIKHVLSDEFDSYVKGDIWRKVLGELLGDGIFTVDGDQWRIHRKLMSTMFSINLLRKSTVAMREKLEQVLNIFQNKVNKSGGFDIDMQEIFFCITFDVSSSVIFGLDFDTVVNQQQDFHRAFDELSSLCHKRFVDPFFEWKKFFNLSSRERRIKQLTRIVDEFAMSVIRDRRNEIDTNERSANERFDLLTKYIEHAKANGEDLPDKYLRDVLMNVMLAGE
jgi:cytochrome P450